MQTNLNKIGARTRLSFSDRPFFARGLKFATPVGLGMCLRFYLEDLSLLPTKFTRILNFLEKKSHAPQKSNKMFTYKVRYRFSYTLMGFTGCCFFRRGRQTPLILFFSNFFPKPKTEPNLGYYPLLFKLTKHQKAAFEINK